MKRKSKEFLYFLQMHSLYQHPSIQLFMMSPKPSNCKVEEIKSEETKQILDDNENEDDNDSNDHAHAVKGDFEGSALLNKNMADWEARRYGAMAAKLLRDVKIT